MQSRTLYGDWKKREHQGAAVPYEAGSRRIGSPETLQRYRPVWKRFLSGHSNVLGSEVENSLKATVKKLPKMPWWRNW